MERKIVTLDNLEYFYQKLQNEICDKAYVDNSIAELVDGAPETLDTLNELSAALNDNADIVDVLNQSIGNKQDAITDLETIRQGAAKGATALQSVKTINGESIVGDGDLITDIVVESVEELDTLDVSIGTKARVFKEIPSKTYDNLNLYRILTMEETNLPEDFWDNYIKYDFSIEVDTSVMLPYDENADHSINVSIPTEGAIEIISTNSDFTSIEYMKIRSGLLEDLYNHMDGWKYGASFLRTFHFSKLLELSVDQLSVLQLISPALNGSIHAEQYTKINDYVKTSEGWVMATVSKKEINDFLVLIESFITSIEVPSKTSELENDSNFISSDGLKTINGESITGNGDITIEGESLTESDIVAMGFTKNTGTYSKPSGGIPKSDLTSAVQTSLGKADTALQSYTEQYKGTITGVSANGTSVATSGVANIPAASTSAYGVTKLSSATNSTSTTLAATPSAVKSAYDLANGKQDKLVSGTNIKTINGTSILGNGNIEISDGSKTYVFDWGNGNVYSGTISAEEFAEMIAADTIIVKGVGGMMREADSVTKVGTSECSFIIHTYISNWIDGVYFNFVNNGGSSEVSWTATNSTSTIPTKTSQLTNDSNFVSSDNLKTINGESIVGSGDIAISGSGGSSSGSEAYSEVNHGTSDTTFTLTPNTFHVWDEVSSLTLTLGSETSGVANEFLFQFTSGSTATTLTLPDDIKWAEELAIEANRIYQISILKGLASALNWENTPEVTLITFYYNGTPYQAEEGMTWAEFADSGYNLGGFYVEYGYVFTGNYQQVYHNYIATIPTEQIVANAFYDNNSGGSGGGGQ